MKSESPCPENEAKKLETGLTECYTEQGKSINQKNQSPGTDGTGCPAGFTARFNDIF